MPWYDRKSGDEIRIATNPLDGTVEPDVIRVRTYRDVLIQYETHPEAKSLAPNGTKVGRETVGKLP